MYRQIGSIQRFFLALLGLICVLSFAACTSTNPSNLVDRNSIARVPHSTASTSLKIAIDPTFPPFQFKTATGEFQGFEIDLLNAIAEAANFTPELQPLPFDDIIRSLYAGSVDATMSSMTITSERSNVVDFTRPYFKSGLAIAVRESETGITGIDTLSGKRIGVQSGTTSEEQASAVRAVNVQRFDSTPLALKALLAGKVEAVVCDAPTATYLSQTNQIQGIKLLTPLLTEEYYGMATPQNSPNLERLNQALTTVLESDRYREMYQKWFGSAAEPPVLPERI